MAKEKAFEVLDACPPEVIRRFIDQSWRFIDACPPEVIRRFINQSWRFIDAYQHGLTGWAAAWVVRKQKGHRSVSEMAMKALEQSQTSRPRL